MKHLLVFHNNCVNSGTTDGLLIQMLQKFGKKISFKISDTKILRIAAIHIYI